MKRILSLLILAALLLQPAAFATEGEAVPESAPAAEAAVEATEVPTPEPTEQPTPEPTEQPTPEPTKQPTPEPTEKPTETPIPTEKPTETPAPTEKPAETPAPTKKPTDEPAITPEAPQASRLMLEAYEITDLQGRKINAVRKDEPFLLMLTFADAARKHEDVDRFTFILQSEDFAYLPPPPNAPLPQAEAVFMPLSLHGQSLRFAARLEPLQLTGEQAQLIFTLRYDTTGETTKMKIDLPFEKPVPTAAPATDSPAAPTDTPAATPSVTPDALATTAPTPHPGEQPTANPSQPTDHPSDEPAATPVPTPNAGEQPTEQPTQKPVPTAVPTATPAPAREPTLLITRDAMEAAKNNTPFTLGIRIQNIGETAVSLPILRIGAAEGFVLLENGTAFAIGNLAPKEETTVRVQAKILPDTLRSPLTLPVALQYEYEQGMMMVRGQAAADLLVPFEESAPTVRRASLKLSAAPPEGTVKAGQAFALPFTLANNGSADAVDVRINAQVDALFRLNENSTAIHIPLIKAGEKKELSINLKAQEYMEEEQGKVSLTTQYAWQDKTETREHQFEETVLINTQKRVRKVGGGGVRKEPVALPVPNLILKSFSFGKPAIAAGDTFDLALEFQNTAKESDIENILITYEVDENLSLTSQSSTTYIDKMARRGTHDVALKMTALPSLKSGKAIINIGLKYEYVQDGKRSTQQLTEKIVIPVYQPDRMEWSAPEMTGTAMVGEEGTLSLKYFNKGKDSVYNVQAVLSGSMTFLNPVQTPGNIESGKSGSIDFLFTPTEQGDHTLQLELSYEDAMQQRVIRRFDVPVKVDGLPEPDVLPDNMPEEENKPRQTSADSLKLLYYILPGALGAALAGNLIHRRIKRKKLLAQMKKDDA